MTVFRNRLGVSLVIGLVFVGQIHCQSDLLAKDNNDVTLTTYKAVKQDTPPGRSLVTSPFSLRIMMAMLMARARGSTKAEIMSAMKFPMNEEELLEPYREYIHLLNSPSQIRTEIANRIFIKEGFLPQENFQNILKHYFGASLQQLSFEKPKKAAEEINEFVARKTNNRITRIVESGDLTNQTRMVLVNTLYFKGAWENPFPTLSTRRMPFYLGEGKRSVSVEMMRVETYMQAKDFPELDCKVVVVPYQKGKGGEDGYQMVILLPNKRGGLEKLEEGLKEFASVESLYSVRPRNIELRLPRFRIESGFDLKETLKGMGVREVFQEEKSDLGGIPSPSKSKGNGKVDENKLYVSKVIQKAFLNVDEAGSEAGAATLSVVFVPLSIGPPVEEVITADHPFFGFIRDTRTNTILFTFRKAD